MSITDTPVGEVDWTDMFCGAGGSSIGIESVPGMRITQALNHWDLAVEAHNANFPHADHDVHDVQEIPVTRFRKTRCLWASPECFEAGTLVLTKRGLIPIESVLVGDYALTHKNRWRRVSRTQSKPGVIGELVGQGLSCGLRVTASHNLWARASRRKHVAEIANHRRLWDEPEWHEAASLPGKNAYWATPTTIPLVFRSPLPAVLEDEVRPWWVIGRWLGDGWVGKDNRVPEVAITCGFHEEETLAGQFSGAWSRHGKRTGVAFYKYDRELGEWLTEHFGAGASGKTVPAWALTMDAGARADLLDGYVSADGHIGRTRTEIATVSKKLAVGIRLLAESLGHSASLHRRDQHATEIEGRKINVLPIYRVIWSHANPHESFFEDTLRWAPVRKWRDLRVETTVYNIEVEDDHSYVADGIVVKNCTHFSYARGSKDYTDDGVRSRSTFKDVVRFTEYHRYDVIAVENVIEARLWCDIKGHRERCSCGGTFDAWYDEMLSLGYEGQIIYFNSQFALPTPQSRDRMYVLFWRKGLKAPNLNFRPRSWCSWCNEVVHAIQDWKRPSPGSVRDQPRMYEWGRYGSQYLYVCPTCYKPAAPAVVGARAIIDWSLPTTKIGDRDKPLAEKTRERIRAGLERLGKVHPVTVQVGGNLFERRPGVRVWSIVDPLRTVTATPGLALVHDGTPQRNEDALIVRYGGQNGNGRGQHEPMQTVTAHDREIGVVIPNREHNTGDQLELPIGTVTTAPAQHMLVQVNRGGRERTVRTLEEPTQTVAGHGELAMVTLRKHSDLQEVDQPVPTVTGGGYHHGLLVYNGVPGFVRDIDDAAGTITSRDKQSLLVPYYSTGVAHPLGEPIGAVTAKDRQALVVTEDDVDECHFRMLQWHELLRAQVPHDHIDGRPYTLTAQRRDKRGNMRELSNEMRVKMVGNMVSSPVAAMIARAFEEILAEAA